MANGQSGEVRRFHIRGLTEPTGGSYYVVDPQAYFEAMNNVRGKLTKRAIDNWVKRGILEGPSDKVTRVGVEDVMFLIDQNIPYSVIYHDYLLDDAASKFLREKIFENESYGYKYEGVSPERFAELTMTPPKEAPTEESTDSTTEEPTEEVTETTEDSQYTEEEQAFIDDDLMSESEFLSAFTEAGESTGPTFDEIDRYIAPFTRGWPKEPREEYRKIALEWLQEKYYQYRLSETEEPQTWLEFLQNDPDTGGRQPPPDLNYMQRARVASLAISDELRNPELLQAVVDNRANKYGMDYTMEHLMEEANAQLMAEREARLAAGAQTGVPMEQRPITRDVIEQRAQLIANEEILRYQGAKLEAPTWDAFIELQSRNFAIESFTPPWGFGVPQASMVVNPLVYYVEKRRALKEGKVFDPKDFYLRIEQEMINDGFSPPLRGEEGYQHLQKEWEYQVAETALQGVSNFFAEEANKRFAAEDVLAGQAGQYGTYRVDTEERLAEITKEVRDEYIDIPFPPSILSGTVVSAEALTRFPGAARRAEGPEYKRTQAMEDYSNYLGAAFDDIVDRERLKGWFSSIYEDYQSLPTTPKAQPFGEYLTGLGEGFFQNLLPQQTVRKPRVRFGTL